MNNGTSSNEVMNGHQYLPVVYCKFLSARMFVVSDVQGACNISLSALYCKTIQIDIHIKHECSLNWFANINLHRMVSGYPLKHIVQVLCTVYSSFSSF